MRLTLTALMVMAAASVFVATAWGAAPPSGRPPVGPLKRVEPKLYDIVFGVRISTLQQIIATDRQNFDLKDTPVAMPLIFMSTFSKIDSESVAGKMWLEAREIDPKVELKSGYPFGTHLAVMNIDRYRGQSLRWQMSFRAQSWSSVIDDAAAARIAWPKEWPKEVQDGLQVQKYIESDNALFKQTVERVSEGKLRLVPPYLAAKDLVRYAIQELQVSGDGIDHGEHGIIRGLEVFGAAEAAKRQIGTPHDLVCICVAMLRAANIPARPVIGIMENEKGENTIVSWAEFYLPDAGWIPFDPYEMRGKGIRHLDVRKPWPEFGTMEDLNRRIPIAYHFIPAATVQSPKNPALWGWDPRPSGAPGAEQQILLTITKRGDGVEDPR